MHFIDDKSSLIQVVAWCRQVSSHYLSQCWPRIYVTMWHHWVNCGGKCFSSLNHVSELQFNKDKTAWFYLILSKTCIGFMSMYFFFFFSPGVTWVTCQGRAAWLVQGHQRLGKEHINFNLLNVNMKTIHPSIQGWLDGWHVRKSIQDFILWRPVYCYYGVWVFRCHSLRTPDVTLAWLGMGTCVVEN